jgi:hypothetical protein
MSPRAVSRATTSAIVERSSEILSPSVRWSMFGSRCSALSAANCGEVMVCDTSLLHRTFMTWSARRIR